MYKFKFADIGEGLHEGVVAEIYKKEGDSVSEGDSLFSVETDKVTSDIPSPATGKVVKVIMNQGDTIHVGDVVYHIDDGKGDSDSAEAEVEEKPADDGAASVVGEVKVSNEVKDFGSMKSNAPAGGTVKSGSTTKTVVNNSGVLATPFARSLAAEKGMDISKVNGSGPGGRVLVSDVENFKSSGASSTGTATPSAGNANYYGANVLTEDKVAKPTGIRKAIAKAMTTSWNSVAYVSLVMEVNMTKIWEERALINKLADVKYGLKLSFTAFIMKATAIALKEFPMMNAKYNATKDELTHFANVNLGMAVDTPRGLMVPVVKNAHELSVVEMAMKVNELAKATRDGSLKPTDMRGGTFSVTNYGSVGAFHGTPVINYPELAILGVGAIVDRVFPKGDTTYNGKVMHITGAADHQWIDGGDLGRFLGRVKELLEHPVLMLGNI